MKANELRAGNYFQWIEIASMGIGVDVITKDNHYTYEDFKESIPLTEEWLVKFGFDWNKSRKALFIAFGTSKTILWYPEHKNKVWLTIRDKAEQVNVNGVHQLQNLYFALNIGEELTITK